MIDLIHRHQQRPVLMVSIAYHTGLTGHSCLFAVSTAILRCAHGTGSLLWNGATVYCHPLYAKFVFSTTFSAVHFSGAENAHLDSTFTSVSSDSTAAWLLRGISSTSLRSFTLRGVDLVSCQAGSRRPPRRHFKLNRSRDLEVSNDEHPINAVNTAFRLLLPLVTDLSPFLGQVVLGEGSML